ncbi:MAG: ImmA/IrrE family metallo-endopeptidase [Bacteroidia bacterium]
MAKVSLLPKGFKSQSEKISVGYRSELKLEPHGYLCGFELAKHLGVNVFTPHDYFGTTVDLKDLIGSVGKDSGWSALTMKNKNNKTIIIHNPLQATVRQQSNMMHELAHIICKHEHPNKYSEINLPEFMRTYDKQQEEEANQLGSTLQITRDGLLWALKQKMTIEEISEHFNASAAMVSLRINTTGVRKQLSYLS